MLRLFPKRSLTRLTQTRGLQSARVVFEKSKLEQDTDDAWDHAKVDRSTISNQAVPQPASDAVPSSMLAAFHNMFDRGPNVGIEVITKHGFVLSNHIKIDQPLILLNGSPFLWNAPPRSPGFLPMKDWDIDTFKIFEVVSPRPELIMFGTGKEFAPIPEHIRKYFFKLGIQVDQMNSKHAAATYNVLAEEGRRVAAALLPLEEKA
ncbi:NADH dehydrogenase 1 alpha subcomplex assembly factor 3 [Mucor mucedo]|uniref:NADH dehydrogenase 1 alpha subcomplex assembly factor 3 n=1 Tax=Mucor mucedo TaxID=29922 RepID=UPI00222125CD|nr:NADH dehydrogenase 1 alpha subcomplex assembly factor 3 [Mucor mucedo]KAI7894981.1 NADH dehydrogenase 1 alpha subcomplex assembly factor 3 [Mucor mucedo]